MENTPMTPYQRNRRAGRMSAPPPPADTAPTDAASPAPVPAAPPAQAAVQPADSAAPVAPIPMPTQTPTILRQPAQVSTPAPAQQARRAAPSPKAINAGPSWSMPAAPRPQQQPYQQGGYYGATRYPSTPAGARKAPQQRTASPAQHASVQRGVQRPGSAYQQERYRSHAPAAAARAEAPEAAEPRVPTWLLSALAVMLIGVMALMTWSIWMQKELRENADAREKAYQNILYEYHLTETDDGRLRVTYQDLIEKYASEYNLQPAFVTAIIRNESSFNTRAESSVGARGLMQMMPDTAEWVGGKLRDDFNYERLWEAETNIRYGCWYLNYLSELFRGDPVMIAAAYHAGQGEVWSWLGNPAISPDGVTVPIDKIPISNTRTYAGRVTKAYGIYQALLYPQDTAAEDAVPAAGGSHVDGGVAQQR